MPALRIPNDDAARALRSMGYAPAEIAGIWPRVAGATVEERLQNALVLLGGGTPEAPEAPPALPHPAAAATLPAFPRFAPPPDTTVRDQLVGALVLLALAVGLYLLLHH